MRSSIFRKLPVYQAIAECGAHDLALSLESLCSGSKNWSATELSAVRRRVRALKDLCENVRKVEGAKKDSCEGSSGSCADKSTLSSRWPIALDTILEVQDTPRLVGKTAQILIELSAL